MKFKKVLSVALAAIMATSAATVAVNAAATNSESVGVGKYYNATYLENYADAAYNEKNLGADYSSAETTFKTWSPDASAVKVKLYKTGSDGESGAGVIDTFDMTKNADTGVWSSTVKGDLKNVYYTYLVTVNGSTKETQDVYSKATGVNGKRSMVVDLDSTDPEGWDSDNHVLFDSASEAVVWEVHVRDFSASENSGVSEQNMGKYMAFAEGGTTLNSDTSDKAVSTGIDYLVEQGINCVQLMPVYDYGSVDESVASNSTNRNWGYDPVNYNVPEGSYSTNAFDGNTRITEFKQMIQALHDRGISVVMDVVYNHTFSTDSCFTNTVPNYYYRMTSAKDFSNGSGCGNETASDKLMYRKYMTESVRYWAEEYHIDGFRFDLMQIHDVTTMNTIRNELDSLYDDGSGRKILMYGEPWAGGGVAITDGCTQGQAKKLDPRVGMFCDSYRDAIKGDTNGSGKGFVQGTTSSTATVVRGVKGKGFNAQAPSQTIAYADAHDNLILWDKIVKSNGSTDWNSSDEKLKGQIKEAMGLLLTSQGIPFMTAGSEFCRTKQGDHNSYKSSDSINNIDWTRIVTYSDIAAYYKGLLQIRENYTPMKSSTFNTPTFQSSSGNVVAYTYSNTKADEWGKVCVLVNSGTQAYDITLDGSGWTVVADGTKAGLESLGTVSGNTFSVPAKNACVLVETATFNNLKASEETFATLNINHVDESGKVLKTAKAKYRAGSTFRAMPDSTILFDYNLVNTEGATSGVAEANKTYNVTYTYKSTGIPSGTLTIEYKDENGNPVKDAIKNRMRMGDKYELPAASVMGYEIDIDNYPADTFGTFTGSDKTVTFRYKASSTNSVKVHYYNSNNWKAIKMYTYTDGGTEPNGAWAKATTMKSEGDNWYTATVPASSAYVMFHNGSGQQEPLNGAQGYLAAGNEVRIQNGVVKFNATVITSHIKASTGERLVNDVVDTKKEITSDAEYKTSPLAGIDAVAVPVNANGNYKAGVTNVVYVYTDDSITPTIKPTTPPVKGIIGDADRNGAIAVDDATLIQKYIASLDSLSAEGIALADGDGNGSIDIFDATYIQKYLAGIDGYMNVGTVMGEEPTEPEPTEPEPTDPKPETYTMVLTNNPSWKNVYCYYWSEEDTSMTVWPGEKMGLSYVNDYGQQVYTIDIPGSAEYIIFTNGEGAQTVNIPVEYSANYWISGGSENSYEVTEW